MAIEIKANIRKVAGKGAARSVRNNKKVPAVVYGDNQSPVSIELDAKEWAELIKKPGLRTKLFKISTDNKVENAMLVDIQYHPVTDNSIHADFKRIDIKKPVSVSVPVEVINVETSRGIKLGGIMNFAVRKLDIVAKIDDVPESVVIDLQDLEIGGVIHGDDIVLPKGVELGLHQDTLAFVTITGKMAEEAEAPKAAAAPAAGAKAAAPAAAAKAAAGAKPAAAAKPAAKK